MNADQIVNALLELDLTGFVDAALGWGSVLKPNPLNRQDNWGPRHFSKTMPFGPKGFLGVAYFNAHETNPASLRFLFRPAVGIHGDIDHQWEMTMDRTTKVPIVQALRKFIQELEKIQAEYREADPMNYQIGNEVKSKVGAAFRPMHAAVEPYIQFERV